MDDKQEKVNETSMVGAEGGEEANDEDKRSKFGTRFLTDPKSVFQHNAWDNVMWDEEQEAEAMKVAKGHVEHALSSEAKDQYEREAAAHWDKFYGIHANHFFKDRHWLFTEFPELYGEDKTATPMNNLSLSCNSTENPDENQRKHGHGTDIDESNKTSSSADNMGENEHDIDIAPFKMLEVGCGVGNTVFPVLKTNKNPKLFVYCCDFSSTAIDIVKAHPDYEQERCHAFVHDITNVEANIPVQKGSLDLISMIFVLSAICPEKMQAAVNHLVSLLKPGGTLLFRDYGRYDMAQLRFKKGRCLSENFYVRGDGTQVYFFTQAELKKLFTDEGLQEKENLIDRRLQVNRSRQLKMYRVWIQCKYVKPTT